MKKYLIIALLVVKAQFSEAQITITASDMPVSGDTLRYSFTNPASFGFSAADSGIAKTWNFSSLSPMGQGVDTFKTALSVNVTYGLTISPTAYGYKVADSFPGLGAFLPVTINQIYNFYNKKSSPSRYVVEGFAAMISSIPTPVNYADEDEWYFFPLNYGNNNNSTFSLNFSLPTLGSLKISGTRQTRVDGWGTIQTPYFTTATDCIRVRTVVDELDSVIIGALRFGLPRKTVEYKFLVNGEHYPALWITANVLGATETIVSVRYRDIKRSTTNIASQNTSVGTLRCYPIPSQNKKLTVEIPKNWGNYQLNLYNMQGKLILHQQNSNEIDMANLASGHFLLQATSDQKVAYATIVN